jgi:DNA-binding Xre family transcriptional regulator
MGSSQEMVEELQRLLAMPEPIDEAAQAVAASGAWGRWSLDRQIWYLRKHSDMSQAELSRKSMISQARISRLEAGADMKLSTLKTLWAPLGYQPLIIPEPLGRERQGRPHRKCWRKRRGLSP